MGSTFYSKRIFKSKHKPKYGRGRAVRPKTFSTMEKAKEHAAKLGIKDFEITQLSKEKFRVDQA